ncbi:alpha-2-macroglobulin-like protein [Plakobranchus ocellatus]|uniref:Alpha-2-macroglobulin-like protein n=1 Tax=Plakobranchus ocellatus TaxID=259542 RepID=A0AAV3Z908_9GAST|nr:alpha-2-macroglobulin-like protein [Plakobranchus ocellatus]
MQTNYGEIQMKNINISVNYVEKNALDLTTARMADFQLDKEAKQGNWRIEVSLEKSDETKPQKTVGKFTVREYVPPHFEIKIEPPPYIYVTDQTYSGRICVRYPDGKPVIGNLSLNLCWKTIFPFPAPPDFQSCHHIDARVSGCYNFSVKASLLSCPFWVFCEFYTAANITEDETGVTASQNKAGPMKGVDQEGFRIVDFTGRYYKPRLPYYGKVIATSADGTPASGIAVEVRADSRDKSLHYSRIFTTDESGVAVFALCGSLPEVTNGMRISAGKPNTGFSNDGGRDISPWIDTYTYEKYYSHQHHVRQWFSPSLSYVQLPKFHSPILCGQVLNLTVLYTARVGSKIQFYYQVMAREQIVMTDQIDPKDTATPGFGEAVPPSDMCLQRDEARSEREPRNDNIADPGMPKVHKRYIFGAVREPVVWSANVSDMVFTFRLDLEIKQSMSPKFTLLLHHVMDDGEVVADSMQYDVEPCLENQVCYAIFNP